MTGAIHSVIRATDFRPPRTTGPVSMMRKTPTIQGATDGTVALMTPARELVCTMTTVMPTETMHRMAKTPPQAREPRPFLM